MELKSYQRDALAALDAFLLRSLAQGGPAAAFAAIMAEREQEALREGRRFRSARYVPLEGLEAVPYACVRLPTGGGKTLLAAETVPLAGRRMGRDAPLALWFAPSDAIKSQTLRALADPAHPYRARLDAAFGGRVRVFDIAAFETIRPDDLATRACVVLSTIQAFRVKTTLGRKVYAYHEELEPHFAGLPEDGMERVSAEEATRSPLLREGVRKASFANLLHAHRPLMIVDEAHGAVTGLTRETQERLNPSAVIEFTATPKNRNNVLFSVTAQALKDEQMIKLPIRLRPHADWREAVTATVAKRNELEEAAKSEAEHLRPIALYQAQPKNGHPTVDELRAYLMGEKLIPEERIKVATGERRELEGVNLGDPREPTRHVITVDALKEGWDCPQAYVLCATQRLSSATAVEQLLGRVLRMPYARRRRAAALNSAYANVSEPNFAEAAGQLRDKLIDMGFTDEEASASLRAEGAGRDAQGGFFDLDPVRPKPVYSQTLAADPGEEALRGLMEAGAQLDRSDGVVTVVIPGDVGQEAAAALEALAPEETRAEVRERLRVHAERIEQAKSPAERGESIAVPVLLCERQGELFRADADLIMERFDWALHPEDARLTKDELEFRRDEGEIVMDIEGERLVFEQQTRSQEALPGLASADDDSLALSLIAWLERECRSLDIPQLDRLAWLRAVVEDLRQTRGIPVRTLIDWQAVLAARLRAKIDRLRQEARQTAYQGALFAPDAAPRADDAAVVRLDAGTYADVGTYPVPGGAKLKRHLFGPDRIQKIDGKPMGEEFACALALDAMEEVEVWARNVASHRDSFWLPRASGRFFPDFIARLNDGQVFVVEYKGGHLVGAPDEREKTAIGHLWARTAGGMFASVEKMKHGIDVAGQLRNAVRATTGGDGLAVRLA